MNKGITLISATAALVVAAGAQAGSSDISVTIENLQSPGGFSFTPFWIAAHNGGFDSYDGGAPAAGFPGLETIAELGDTAPLSAAFAASAAGLAGGVDATVISPSTAPPVFAPGDSETHVMSVGDATVNRYFSYASMLIPSNDFFVANGNPGAHMLFDAAGNFTGPITIDIYGRDVNDAGTEENDALNGPAFVAGIAGTDGAMTNENVFNIFDDAGTPAYLNSLVGANTPLGVISQAFGPDDLIGRITITPSPSGVALLGLAGLTGVRRRR